MKEFSPISVDLRGVNLLQKRRMLGGDRSRLGQFPYMTMVLYIRPNESETHYCGGSILAKNWVLTAAHCIDSINNTTLVLAGRYAMNKDEESEQASAVYWREDSFCRYLNFGKYLNYVPTK